VRSPPDPSGRRVQMKHFVLVLVLAPVRMLAVARTIAAATVVASGSVRAMARRAHGGGQHTAAQRSIRAGTRGKEGQRSGGHLPKDLTATPDAGTRQGQGR
jgi:hypothetical protein